MFTGIIETLGVIEQMKEDGTNLQIWMDSDITDELKVDQSVAHNGVCLTIVEINDRKYRVTAIDETLKRTSIGAWKIGDRVNLERCMIANGRFDGHVVQGHVDTVAKLQSLNENDGSWNFVFKLSQPHQGLIVEKGSICVAGVSLTVSVVSSDSFMVSIIPYTYDHTSFGTLSIGDLVNIEFDVLGKYVQATLRAQAEGSK